MDFGSEEEDSLPSKMPPARVYVDPWDLENYAFMRRNLEGTPEPESFSGQVGEPTSSNLYYTPANYDYRNEMHRRSSSRSRFSADSPTVFAAIDEVDFHNDNFEIPSENVAPFYQHFYEDHLDRKFQVPRPCFTESGSSLSSGNENHYMYSSEPRGPTSLDNSFVYVYEKDGRKRSIVALPVKERRASTQQYVKPRNRKMSRMRSANCPDCQLLEQAGYVSHYDLARAAMMSSPSPKAPPENFGLSQYGHLKIDYSCSWHSLDQLISQDS